MTVHWKHAKCIPLAQFYALKTSQSFGQSYLEEGAEL